MSDMPEIEARIADLVTQIRERRSSRKASRGLAAFGAPAIAALQPLLRDKNRSVRRRAVDTLAAIGTEAVIALLVSALSDARADVRIAAARGLRRWESDLPAEALARLAERLCTDRAETVRQAIIAALKVTGNATVVPALLDMLAATRPLFVRRDAADALAAIAERHPALICRHALPLLRPLGRSLWVGRHARRVFTDAAQQIENTTRHLKDVPLTAQTVSAVADDLPLPAATAIAESKSLPIAADTNDQDTAAPSHPFWARWRKRLRRR